MCGHTPAVRGPYLVALMFSGFCAMSGMAHAQEAPAEGDRPLGLGRLLGAQAGARLRAGLWIGNLSPGLFSSMSSSEVTQPEGSAIGFGSGFVSELGVSLTLGDYDFAFGFLTDQLIDFGGDDVGDVIAQTVLRQIAGQLRTRALESLVGTEVGASVRFGDFTGPIDGRKFGFRDNVPWFGGGEESWDTAYLSAQIEAKIATIFSDFMYIRYTQFSTPQVFEIIGVQPVGVQETGVNAAGLGFSTRYGGDDVFGPIGATFELSLVPLTGVARFDYGPWGSLWGLLLEFETSLIFHARIEVASVFALRPYAGFRASMLSPVSGSFDADDPNAVLLLTPDFLLWGPVFGLEVEL